MDLRHQLGVSHHDYIAKKSISELRELQKLLSPTRRDLQLVRNARITAENAPTAENVESYRQIHRKAFLRTALPEIIRISASKVLMRFMVRSLFILRYKRFIQLRTVLPQCLVNEVTKFI